MNQLAYKLALLPSLGLSASEINSMLCEPSMGRSVSGPDLLDLTLGIIPEGITQEQLDALETSIDEFLLLVGELTSEVGFE